MRWPIVLFPLIVLAPACKKDPMREVPAESKQVFEQRCANCHGTDGRGAGPAGAMLNPKPRDFTDAVWQASVTDDHLEKVIVKGGAAVGKSPLMAANPDLEGKPEVVKGLVRMVRSFKP